MMGTAFLRAGIYAAALIGVLGGLSILGSDQPLRSICRTSCWLNDLLSIIFGERAGKLALSGLWFAASLWLVGLARKLSKKISD